MAHVYIRNIAVSFLSLLFAAVLDSVLDLVLRQRRSTHQGGRVLVIVRDRRSWKNLLFLVPCGWQQSIAVMVGAGSARVYFCLVRRASLYSLWVLLCCCFVRVDRLSTQLQGGGAVSNQ